VGGEIGGEINGWGCVPTRLDSTTTISSYDDDDDDSDEIKSEVVEVLILERSS
jgi:hypothetical protein